MTGMNFRIGIKFCSGTGTGVNYGPVYDFHVVLYHVNEYRAKVGNRGELRTGMTFM